MSALRNNSATSHPQRSLSTLVKTPGKLSSEFAGQEENANSFANTKTCSIHVRRLFDQIDFRECENFQLKLLLEAKEKQAYESTLNPKRESITSKMQRKLYYDSPTGESNVSTESRSMQLQNENQILKEELKKALFHLDQMEIELSKRPSQKEFAQTADSLTVLNLKSSHETTKSELSDARKALSASQKMLSDLREELANEKIANSKQRKSAELQKMGWKLELDALRAVVDSERSEKLALQQQLWKERKQTKDFKESIRDTESKKDFKTETGENQADAKVPKARYEKIITTQQAEIQKLQSQLSTEATKASIQRQAIAEEFNAHCMGPEGRLRDLSHPAYELYQSLITGSAKLGESATKHWREVVLNEMNDVLFHLYADIQKIETERKSFVSNYCSSVDQRKLLPLVKQSYPGELLGRNEISPT